MGWLKNFAYDVLFVCIVLCFCCSIEIIFYTILIYSLWMHNHLSYLWIIIPIYYTIGMYLMDYGHKFFQRWDFLQKWAYRSSNHWLRGQNELVFLDESTKTKIQDEKKVLIGSHPHGFMPVAAGVHGYLHPFFRKLNCRGMTHRLVLANPLNGIYYRFLGMESISNKNMKSMMKNSEECLLEIVPGGGDEMTYSKPNEHVLFINHRKGFVKYCLRFGFKLTPMFHFGQTELFDIFFTTELIPRSKGRMEGWKGYVHLYFQFFFLICSVFFLRGYNFLLFCIPKKSPLYTFVGDVIDVPKIENPAKEEVDKYHEMYVKELIRTRERGEKMMMSNPRRFKNYERVLGKLKIM